MLSDSPFQNTIILYIIIISVILLCKPHVMYDYNTNTFKSFGLKENQTICAFPLVAIGTGIVLYAIFLMIHICCSIIESR
jgi:hypothetical protein